VGDDNKSPEQETFDERLNRAQMKARGPEAPDEPDTASRVAFKMGVDLVAGTGVGLFMGYWIDKWFDTAPVFLIVLLILGFVTGLRNVIVEAMRIQKASEEADLAARPNADKDAEQID